MTTAPWRSEVETVARCTEPVGAITVPRVSDSLFDGLGIDAREDGVSISNAGGANIGGGGAR